MGDYSYNVTNKSTQKLTLTTHKTTKDHPKLVMVTNK